MKLSDIVNNFNNAIKGAKESGITDAIVRPEYMNPLLNANPLTAPTNIIRQAAPTVVDQSRDAAQAVKANPVGEYLMDSELLPPVLGSIPVIGPAVQGANLLLQGGRALGPRTPSSKSTNIGTGVVRMGGQEYDMSDPKQAAAYEAAQSAELQRQRAAGGGYGGTADIRGGDGLKPGGGGERFPAAGTDTGTGGREVVSDADEAMRIWARTHGKLADKVIDRVQFRQQSDPDYTQAGYNAILGVRRPDEAAFSPAQEGERIKAPYSDDNEGVEGLKKKGITGYAPDMQTAGMTSEYKPALAAQDFLSSHIEGYKAGYAPDMKSDVVKTPAQSQNPVVMPEGNVEYQVPGLRSEIKTGKLFK